MNHNTINQELGIYRSTNITYKHHDTYSEITLLSHLQKAKALTLEIRTSNNTNIEALRLFCQLIEDNQKHFQVMQRALNALKLCMDERGFSSFLSEQAVEHSMREICEIINSDIYLFGNLHRNSVKL